VPALLLYNSPVSGNCYKVRLLFAQMGIPYERREVSVIERSGREQLLGELNPALRVPTLVLDDGRALAESNAILCYFGEDSAYLPEDRFERAQVMQWLFFEQYSHEPNLAVARFLVSISDRPVPQEYVAGLRKAGHKALAGMEQWLRGRCYLVAERYTIADIALYAYTHVAEEGGFELEPYPAIRAWLERVAAQPAHVPITD
jgi:glutathione S-transferase